MFSASQTTIRARRRGAFGAQSQADVGFSAHSNMHVLCVSSRPQGTQAWRLWRAVTSRGVFLRTFEYACSLRLKPLSGHAGVAPLARKHRPRCVSPHIRICMFSASQATLRARRRPDAGFSVHLNMHFLCASSHAQGTQAGRAKILECDGRLGMNRFLGVGQLPRQADASVKF